MNPQKCPMFLENLSEGAFDPGALPVLQGAGSLQDFLYYSIKLPQCILKQWCTHSLPLYIFMEEGRKVKGRVSG